MKAMRARYLSIMYCPDAVEKIENGLKLSGVTSF